MALPDPPTLSSRRPARVLWLAAGFVCVGLGFVGAVVPLMPSTVFFIAAAHCFARSSDRFLSWLLGLPVVGRMVRDYRAGGGMPVRAKAVAVSTLGVAVAWSAWVIPSMAGKLSAVLLGAAGAWYILRRVPTRR